MRFNMIEIVRIKGQQRLDPESLCDVNALTSRAFGAPVPLEETYKHLIDANLKYFIYAKDHGKRRLVGYSLNHIYELQVGPSSKRINYFVSAFLDPELQRGSGVYQFLGSLRVTGDEDFFMVCTQNPLVVSSFARVARTQECRLFTPLHRRIPREVKDVVRQSFGDPALIRPGMYGRCLTGTPIEPRTSLTREIMSCMDPLRGDACLLVAKRTRVTSMLQDVEAGRPVEIDTLVGLAHLHARVRGPVPDGVAGGAT
jgi:ketopantoate reductase